MTVCIAAICDNGNAIVAASDKMLSMGGYISADSIALKCEPFCGEWFTMFSGDISVFQPLVRRVADRLSEPDPNMTAVMAAFEAEYAATRRRKAEQEVLSVYGLNMDDFLRRSHEFDASTVTDLRQRIDAVELGDSEFLVFGFDRPDAYGEARIFTVRPPHGTAIDCSLQGFWAIGSGAPNALSILYLYPYSISALLPDAIYHVCEAKFMAESALGVGKDTSLFIYRSNGVLDYHTGGPNPLLTLIRDRWENDGKPHLPGNISADIQDCWKKHRGLPLRFDPKKQGGPEL